MPDNPPGRVNAAASEPLGILYLRGDLADPGLDAADASEQGRLRYDAGLRYARDHAIASNRHPGRPNPSPGSHLAAFLTDDRLRSATARVIALGPYPLFVLEDVAVYRVRMRFMDEERVPPYLLEAERLTIAALRSALGVLVREYR
jgi:hypothetical protein